MSDLHCPTTVIVLRHGQSEGNLTRALSSAWPGEPLTALGRQQAADAALALAGRRVARVYASPLLRARQTAVIIAEHLDAGPVQTLEALREFDLGVFEGSTAPDHVAQVDAVFGRWLAGELDVRVPGGSSGREVTQRVAAALGHLADMHRGETVVLVSHGGTMTLGLTRLTGQTRGGPGPLSNGAAAELVGDADGWRLVSWPETPAAAVEPAPFPGDRRTMLGHAQAERLRTPVTPGSGAVQAVVEGVPCLHLPLPYAWATQAALTELDVLPGAATLRAVRQWLGERAPAWSVVVDGTSAATAAVAALPGLSVQQRLGVWSCQVPPTAVATPGSSAASPTLELRAARDGDEFLQAYGPELAPWVASGWGRPEREFLVLADGADVAACVMLHATAGTTYLSGVTVTPERRGEGLGRLVTALGTQQALRRSPLVWLHCADDVSGLYEGLGYDRVTTHVHLTGGPQAGR